MILTYMDNSGPDLYNVRPDDLPKIRLEAFRKNDNVVWFFEREDPEVARRIWWINGLYYGESTTNFRIFAGILENFTVKVRKFNTFGPSLLEATFSLPRTDHNAPPDLPDININPGRPQPPIEQHYLMP